jgi:hypothetical protein
MRKLTVMGLTAVLVGGAAWAVSAKVAHGTTPVSCMDTVWRTSSASTSSTKWSTVSGLVDSPAAIYPIAINVSAVVSGAPVDFRILSTNVGDQTVVSQPGPAPFVPGSNGANSFAYQWVERNQSAAQHANQIQLQWRSQHGGSVTLQRGDMSLLYTSDSCQGA